jgi:hypothetical protein
MTHQILSPLLREGQGWVTATCTVADTHSRPLPQGREEIVGFVFGYLQ